MDYTQNAMTSSVNHETDLPLMSNADQIRARHYMIKLKVNFKEKIFHGEMLIFLEPISKEEEVNEEKGEEFKCVLDCCDIDFLKVQSVEYELKELCNVMRQPDIATGEDDDTPHSKDNSPTDITSENSYRNPLNRVSMQTWFNKARHDLPFSVHKWSIDIIKPGCKTAQEFPRVLYFRYRTRTSGLSVNFRSDDAGNAAVFTPAASINNRSLFPCQEPPIAMAKWQAEIRAPEGYIVLCAGDENEQVFPDEDAKYDNILINEEFESDGITDQAERHKNTNQKEALSNVSTDCINCCKDKFTANCSNKCKKPPVSHQDKYSSHYFYTNMILPMSTFAIAIGKWSQITVVSLDKLSSKNVPNPRAKCRHEPYPCHVKRGDSGPLLPCRLFGPEKLLKMVEETWPIYLKACLEASYTILGSHPFSRLDLLILPRSFSGLGLASPSLIFLSQSLLLYNGSDAGMAVRLAHEISHSWFGLVIGAMDWTEEWLSEGFATFAEDPIHSLAMELIKKSHPGLKRFMGYSLDTDWSEVSRLRAIIRYRTLSAELDNTGSDLQKMRPMLGNELRDSDSKALFVKNGINPEISYTQVHYIKGYFLLRHLHDLVPTQEFFRMLRHYVHDLYHGNLVHSTEFLQLYFKTFPNVPEDLRSICHKWLDNPGMSTDLIGLYSEEKNKEVGLYKTVVREVAKWSDFNDKCFKRKRKHQEIESFETDLVSEQKVLILEGILDLAKVHLKVLDKLDSLFQFEENANADVLHRWCELIVKAKDAGRISCVKRFLVNHQAMGIYLYGELALSSLKTFKLTGLEMFKQLRDEMDKDFVTNIDKMFQ